MKREFFNLMSYLLIIGGILFHSCEEGSNVDELQPDLDSSTKEDSTSTDSTSDESSSSIIGVWTFHSANIEALINGQELISYLMDLYEISEEEAKKMQKDLEEEYDYHKYMGYVKGSSVEFKEDGTFTASYPDGNESGSWNLNEDELTLSYEDESQIVDVISLTTNEIELGLDEEIVDDIDGDEEDDTISISIRLNLKK